MKRLIPWAMVWARVVLCPVIVARCWLADKLSVYA
jgi:hypothetical protein